VNQKQALAKLRAKLGAKLGWRIDDRAPDEQERLEERELSRPHRADAVEYKALLDARRAELLKDPEYVRLREQYKASDDAANRALSRSMSSRITVGKFGDLGFFIVVASGDTWDEVVRKVSEGVSEQKS